MSSIKALASQTVWYGFSTIASRFLNYLLTPLLTYLLSDAAGMRNYGELTILYAAIAFANVLFTHGMETAYFRFSHMEGVDKKELYRTSLTSLLVSTLVLAGIGWLFRGQIAHFFGLKPHPEYITFCLWIIAFDTLAALPFAYLRGEGRPKRYAFIKVAGILVNIVCTAWVIGFGPQFVQENPGSFYARWSAPFTATGLLLLCNLAASAVTFFLLFREWKGFRFKIDPVLWRRIMGYALPFIIIGLGGMVNETLDRILLQRLLPASAGESEQQVAIYGACYKLAILITLFIQAFRMAAEPFFFKEAGNSKAPATYAKVMHWFVITLCAALLGTVLFLDGWQYMIGKAYRSGLGVIPILLWANVALGIYYNLSVWYKNTGNLGWGTVITLIGAAITLVLNIALIPHWGILAAAWATFACYFTMMLLSFFLGQKYYPIPYSMRATGSYLLLALALQAVHTLAGGYLPAGGRLLLGTGLYALFFFAVLKREKAMLKRLPVVGKWL